MKTVLITFILITCHCLAAQQVIKINGCKGVLFADTVKLDFSIDSVARQFTPSKDEALLAEELLLENKDMFVKSWGRSFNKEVKKSNRQFVGYYDLREDKHILVFLLNVSKSNSKHYFKTWLTKPIVGFGEFYEKNLKILDVNLSQHNAKIY